MSKKEKLKVFSVFSGVAGFEIGLDKNKFEVVGFAENDPHCSAVLNYHWKDVPNYGDVKEINYDTISSVNICCGGTPCQDLSISRGDDRKGLDGRKSGLFFEYIKIVKKLQPDYFIWENVKGSFNSRNGWDFARVQMEMASTGYDIRWDVLPSQEYGIPQVRERVFIIGVNPKARGRKVFGEARINYKDAEVWGNNIENPEEEREVRSKFDADTKDLVVAYSKSTRKRHIDHRIRVNDTANTFTCGKGCISQSSGTYVAVDGDPNNIRHLTPLECERLMGWPDNHTKFGLVEDKVVEMSDTQRWSMCGNGIVSTCAKSVADFIYDCHYS